MITSYDELKYYLECDKVALYKCNKRPSFFGDEIWKFQRLLRYREFLIFKISNSCGLKKSAFLIMEKIFHLVHKRYALKLNYTIPLNTCDAGLSLVHPGAIVIASGACIGRNCRIHEGVTIGATNGSNLAATIGDNVFISSGAKIIGDVFISDNCQIGANAVVVKDVIAEKGCTVGGVPAKIISNSDSSRNLIKATVIVDQYWKK